MRVTVLPKHSVAFPILPENFQPWVLRMLNFDPVLCCNTFKPPLVFKFLYGHCTAIPTLPEKFQPSTWNLSGWVLLYAHCKTSTLFISKVFKHLNSVDYHAWIYCGVNSHSLQLDECLCKKISMGCIDRIYVGT